MLPEITIIKRKRKQLDLTQKKLANEAKVSQSLIAKLESGKAEASYEKVKRILEVLDRKSIKEDKKCKDVMSKNIISIKEYEKVKNAAELMKKHSISQLPVFKDNMVTGSISESTIINKLDKEIYEKQICNIMDEPFPIVDKETSINAILPLLKNYQAILISEKGNAIGIITKADVI